MSSTSEVIIVEQFAQDNWAGILLVSQRLKASTFLKRSKEELVSYLSRYSSGSFIVRTSTHELLTTIRKIVFGQKYTLPPNIEFDFSGYTPKEIRVLRVVAKIPLGHTMSYGEVAKKAGLKNAARFVGTVMRKNRFAPIIPCHRVVRADGKIGRYSISLEPVEGKKIKEWLIAQEKRVKVR